MFERLCDNHSIIICRTFSSSRTEILSPVNTNSPPHPQPRALALLLSAPVAFPTLGTPYQGNPTVLVHWCLDSSKMSGHGTQGLGGVLDLRVGIRFQFIRIKSPFFS